MAETDSTYEIQQDDLKRVMAQSPASSPVLCAKCGGSGEIEIGCATDHALTAPCVECRGTGNAQPLSAATPTPVEHPFGPCGYRYCDWPDGELRCNEPRAPSPSVREAAEEIAKWINWRGSVPEIGHAQNVTTLTRILSKYFCSPVSAAGGDEDVKSPLEPLENELIQTAIAAHCRAEDSEAQDAFHAAASALIEARYQSVKSAGRNRY